MGRLLCVWEQGGHLGHLSHLRMPVEVALAAGHTVYVAVRELQQVRLVLGDLPVQYLLSPCKPDAPVASQQEFLSYTQLLDRQCFGSAAELQLYLGAWRTLFDVVQPDLVLFEHSPTALVAAHAYRFKKVNIGTGFTVPPGPADGSAPFLPFPHIRLTPQTTSVLLQADRQMLERINQSLAWLGAAPLPNLHAIFAQVDAQYLMTWPELDQFGERSSACYLGVEPPLARALPEWPSAGGQKVFAYIDAFPALEVLLQDLRAASTCCLLFVRKLPNPMRQAFTSASMQFVDHPVDLAAVASQADWVISHGGHSTVAFFARKGLAQLLIPRHQEQLFTALRVVSQGGAGMAFQDQSAYGAAVTAMVGNAQLRSHARTLGVRLQRHAEVDLRNFMHTALQPWLTPHYSLPWAGRCVL